MANWCGICGFEVMANNTRHQRTVGHLRRIEFNSLIAKVEELKSLQGRAAESASLLPCLEEINEILLKKITTSKPDKDSSNPKREYLLFDLSTTFWKDIRSDGPESVRKQRRKDELKPQMKLILELLKSFKDIFPPLSPTIQGLNCDMINSTVGTTEISTHPRQIAYTFMDCVADS